MYMEARLAEVSQVSRKCRAAMAQSMAASAESGPLVLAVPAELQSARLASKKYLQL